MCIRGSREDVDNDGEGRYDKEGFSELIKFIQEY